MGVGSGNRSADVGSDRGVFADAAGCGLGGKLRRGVGDRRSPTEFVVIALIVFLMVSTSV